MGKVKINLPKAQEIAHEMRRAKREREFAPLDEIIAKELPGHDLAQVRNQRQAIRDKYAVIQNEIDSVVDVEALRAKVVEHELV